MNEPMEQFYNKYYQKYPSDLEDHNFMFDLIEGFFEYEEEPFRPKSKSEFEKIYFDGRDVSNLGKT